MTARPLVRPTPRAVAHLLRAASLLIALLAVGAVRAEVPVTSTVRQLPSSNGHGAILLDLETRRLTHFREHAFASEEPLLDGQGKEQWLGNQPLAVPSRDLLYDAYFGLRVGGQQAWLTNDPLDGSRSGYVEHASGTRGGTGIVRMVQSRGALELTQYAFAPRGLAHAGFVMILRVTNKGATPVTGIGLFSLHNFHLGFGRPGARQEIGENGETAFRLSPSSDLGERAFAGVVVARPLTAPTRHAASHALAPSNDNLFAIGSTPGADYPDRSGEAPTRDATITGFQWNVGTLAPGADAWVGVAFAHHGDPFAAAEVQDWLETYVKGRTAKALLENEIDEWSAFQSRVTAPKGLTEAEESLYRHGAAMLAMAQVRESDSFLREWLTMDGEPRFTRFGPTLGAPPASLPARVAHRGHGAVLASLPPGEWTVSWLRDGTVAAAALARMGLKTEARDALAYFLDAEGGRFQNWMELSGYGMPPYRLSLVRYHGFGVEETDFNDFGPNLEFDGFGLFLWALRHYHRESADDAFLAARWPTVKELVADPLVALVDPSNGLIRADSSIWETHWLGRERQWAFTSITAARGLCDAASLAASVGDSASAITYRSAAESIRRAIADSLTDADGAIASNREELASGRDYWDAAVLDAIALELFDPEGRIAAATLAGIEAHLRVPAGAGWSRNDDRSDHSGAVDLSPWGSEYDSGEWVFVDLRGAVAASLMGHTERARRLTDWVGAQADANFLAMAEVFDEVKGTYKFNTPMMGFGAGAYALALLQRTTVPDPACGSYFDEGTGGGASASTGAGPDDSAPGDDGGCSCRTTPTDGRAGAGLACAALVAAVARRRVRNARAR